MAASKPLNLKLDDDYGLDDLTLNYSQRRTTLKMASFKESSKFQSLEWNASVEQTEN